MIRAHIYIEDYQQREIELRARREKKPRAQVIREVLDAGLSGKKSGQTTKPTLLRLSQKAIPGLPADMSSHIDDYLYSEWNHP